jgi:hypothetical protein
MPIISFPSAPNLNDTYSFNGKTWIYNGEGWMLSAAGSINGIPIGNVTPATGNFTTVGATGNITTDQYFIGNGSQLTGITASGMLTVSNIAPISPSAGDVWIAANTGAQYVYFTSGGNSQWAEMEADTSISITTSSGANIDLTAVASNIIPSANITYDIGNTSNRFRDIYLANSTIYLGDAEISANGSNVVLASAVITSAVIASATLGNINNDSTGYMSLPVGNTAQRPVAPTAGMIRFNTTTNSPEWYDPIGNQWLNLSQGPNYNVEYLVIAGGGGGGGARGGGGGAGGYRTDTGISVSVGTNYTVTVGAGGTAGPGSVQGTSGGNSVFSSITSIGGGAGGTGFASSNNNGLSGGSGGGGAALSAPTGGTGGSATPGQGFAGASSLTGGEGYSGGGGGGSSSVGTTGSVGNAPAGNGGAGTASSITGTSVTYAGGGGGGNYSAAPSPARVGGTGGSGGGGNGGAWGDGPGVQVSATAGTTNRGSGGGGGGNTQGGAAGGSGIVIIRYLGAQRGSGGTVTSADGYTIHTFTSSGTYTA